MSEHHKGYFEPMMMADPQMLLTLTKNYLARNNPIDQIMASIKSTIEFIITMPSQKKLLKYRSMIYLEQLESIETNLNAGKTAPRGSRMDRFY
jgi:hypothetical protein